jgi:hypothetical protein
MFPRSLATNAPQDHPAIVGEYLGHEINDDIEKKFQTRLAPHDQHGREAPPNHMEDHHALD